MPLFSMLFPTIIGILLHQALGGTVILGTSFLDQGGNKSDSVESVHFTRPVDGWVQLNDTYHAFSIVKAGSDCPRSAGYLLVQVRIGNMVLNITRDKIGYESWNINVKFAFIDACIYTVQLNITFDNATFNGITEKLNEAKMSSLSLRFIYKDYANGDTSSPPAYIHILNINSHPDQIVSSLLSTSSTTEPRGDTEADTISLGIQCDTNSFSAAGSSLKVQHAAKFYVFNSLIILLYQVVS